MYSADDLGLECLQTPLKNFHFTWKNLDIVDEFVGKVDHQFVKYHFDLNITLHRTKFTFLSFTAFDTPLGGLVGSETDQEKGAGFRRASSQKDRRTRVKFARQAEHRAFQDSFVSPRIHARYAGFLLHLSAGPKKASLNQLLQGKLSVPDDLRGEVLGIVRVQQNIGDFVVRGGVQCCPR